MSKHTQGCVTPGAQFGYQIVYQNNLPDTTFRSVTITDTLPNYVHYAGGADWLCVGQICTYTVAEILPQTIHTRTLPVVLDANFPYTTSPTIRNTLRIAYGNFYALESPIEFSSDLAIALRDNRTPGSPVHADERITYTLEYSNAGSLPAQAVVLTETLPAYTTYVGSGWTAAGNGRYTLSVGDLAAGAGGAAEFVVQVDSMLPADVSVLTNQAQIGGLSPECNLSNNVAYVATPIAITGSFYLYVANLDSHTVGIYDAQTFEYQTSFEVDASPFGMASDGNYLFVAVQNDSLHGSLSIVDLASYTVLTQTATDGAAFYPAELDGLVYVSQNDAGNGVSVFTRSGNRLTALSPGGFRAMTDDPIHQRVYVGRRDAAQPGLWTLRPLPGNTFALVESLQTGTNPDMLVYSQPLDRLYTVFSAENMLRVYDPDTFALLGEYPTGSQDPTASGNGGLGLATLGQCAYVSNYAGRSVTVLSEGACAAGGAVLKTGERAMRIFLPLIVKGSAAPAQILVTASVTTIPVGGQPKGIAAGGGLVFVTLPPENRVAVIDPHTQAVIHEISTQGDHPHTALVIANPPAGWKEVGFRSATAGGISDSGAQASYPALAVAPDNTPYVAWQDNHAGNNEIYVRRWQNGVWEPVGGGEGAVSNNAGASEYPALAFASDGTLYAAWQDNSTGTYQIYVRRWDGAGWADVGAGSSSGGGVSNNSGHSHNPALAVAPDGAVYVTWYDMTSGDDEIYVRHWDGSNWAEVGSGSATGRGISNNEGISWYPRVAVAPDGTPYITWHNQYGAHTEIYVRRWDGTTWAEVGAGSATGQGISRNEADSWEPDLAIAADGTPYITWHDHTVGYAEIYVRRWNGTTWEEVGSDSADGGGISNTPGESKSPSLSIDTTGTPYIAWHDWTPGEAEIYVRRWNGETWEEAGAGAANDGGISHDVGRSRRAVIAIGQDNIPYIAWDNDLNGVKEVYVRRWK